MYFLVNYERNYSIISRAVHLRYMDLAIVFYRKVTDEKGKERMLLYTEEEIREKGWNTQWMEKMAAENTQRELPAVLKPMDEVICELGGEELLHVDQEMKIPMYVLTNREKWLGAACILYPGLLSQISRQLQDDFYVLPSSIHECIIVPASGAYTGKELEKIVTEINETEVPEGEILSDKAYFYEQQGDVLTY